MNSKIRSSIGGARLAVPHLFVRSTRDLGSPVRWVIFLAVVLGCAVRLSAADRPNFVWLISEDNSKHFLRLFDEHGAETPRIEALAEQGLVFERAFSCGPVCSVARTTLMTACYGPRIGTQFHRRSVMAPMPDGVRMFPAYLRDAGYHTTNRQKKDYNAVEGEGVWDASSGRATWRNRNPGQPFFHMQSFGTTHESSLHFDLNTMRTVATDTDPDSVFVPPLHPDTATFRYTYARYHDRIRRVDGEIGAVVDRLREDGLLEDTFVFHFGDHGGVLPGSKGYAYETGLHVPLVVRIPAKWRHLVDAPIGSRTRGFVGFIDFGPTLLNLAGIDVPAGVDGRPFLGQGVRWTDLNRRDTAFGYADRFDEKYDLVRTLRQGRFKYIRSYQPFNFDGLQNNYRYKMLAFAQWRDLFHAGELDRNQRRFFERRPAEALYDIDRDPYEINDLSAKPEHAETLSAMRRRLTEWVKGMPDLSFFPENHLVDHAYGNPVEFGEKHRDAIARLVDIANLELTSIQEARAGIQTALGSALAWERYWGLIACSTHGAAAGEFIADAKRIAASDPEPLVRVRAAEFLGLIGAAPPQPVILEALESAASGPEANLMLNSLVLLRDGVPGYDFSADSIRLTRDAREFGDVKRRMEYLGTTGL